MAPPSRAAVVVTGSAAGAALLATWLAVRGAIPPDGGTAPDGHAWPWTVLLGGTLLSHGLGLATALAAHARLRGRWTRPPVVVAAAWLTVLLATTAAIRVDAPDAYVDAVGLVVLYGSFAGFVVVPLGGLALTAYVGIVLTPPRPRSPFERVLLAAGFFWTFGVVPTASLLIDLDLSAFEGFT